MQVTFTETAKPKITIRSLKCGYWVVDKNNGRAGYEWGGSILFHKSWEEAWKSVFGVSPR